MAGNPSEALAATARQSGSALAALAATARQSCSALEALAARSSQAVRTATRARTSAAKGVTRLTIGIPPSSGKKEKDGPAEATAVIISKGIAQPSRQN